MKVNLISRDNGVGLTQDAAVLREALEPMGCDVRFFDWQEKPRTADINIFLELYNPAWTRRAGKNYGIFNPEWFMTAWLHDLRRLDSVLCKTRHAIPIFAQYAPVQYISFTSRDYYDQRIPREERALHVRGKSSYKGSNAILDLYYSRRNKRRTIPRLTYLSRSLEGAAVTTGLVSAHNEEVPEQTLRLLMNTHLFHLCPSEAEGFGHYLNEAAAVGAIILTTDAPPMNELVTPASGVLLPYSDCQPKDLSTRYFVSPDDILQGIQRAQALEEGERLAMRHAARAGYLARKKHFVESMEALVR